MDSDFHLLSYLNDLNPFVSTILSMPRFEEPYETAIIGPDKTYAFQKRYKKVEEAMAGHNEIVKDVRTNPEKYLI